MVTGGGGLTGDRSGSRLVVHGLGFSGLEFFFFFGGGTKKEKRWKKTPRTKNG